MGRLFTGLGVFILVLALLIACFQPGLPYIIGSGFLRNNELVRVRWETRNWPVMADRCFEVSYRPGDQESARLVLKEAERVYAPLEQLFGQLPEGTVPIVVYSDKNSLNRVFGWGSGESAMGVYWAGVVRVLSPRAWIDQLPDEEAAVVFRQEGPVAHELVHLLVDYRTGGNYTRWLTEGLAQYGEAKVSGGPGQEQPLPPLNCSLEELDKRFDEPSRQEYSYAVARGMVIFLVNRYGEERLPALLQALGRGQSLDSSFRSVFGVSLGEFLEAYNNSACL